MLDAEVRIGELMRAVPKAQGKRTDIKPTDTAVGKYEVIEKAGFTPKQVERFETLAAHPEIVAQASNTAAQPGRSRQPGGRPSSSRIEHREQHSSATWTKNAGRATIHHHELDISRQQHQSRDRASKAALGHTHIFVCWEIQRGYPGPLHPS